MKSPTLAICSTVERNLIQGHFRHKDTFSYSLNVYFVAYMVSIKVQFNAFLEHHATASASWRFPGLNMRWRTEMSHSLLCTAIKAVSYRKVVKISAQSITRNGAVLTERRTPNKVMILNDRYGFSAQSNTA